MLSSLLLLAAAMTSPEAGQTVQSANGEFIFSQYPPRALAKGEQGIVQFRANADDKGNVLSCKVTQSSGFKRLDRETCDLIIDHASFRPALDRDGKAREAVHDGYVNWRIPGTTPATATEVASNSTEEVVCKRVNKTGSLVGRSRLCMTEREWIRYVEQNQDRVGEIQGRFGSSREDQPTFPSEINMGLGSRPPQ